MSDEHTPIQTEETIPSQATEPPPESPPEIDQSSKIQELEEQLKRSLADYQNLQKRIQAERSAMHLYAAEGAMKALIPTLDNFYYAWRNAPSEQNEELIKFYDSMKMLYNNMLQSLSTLGLEVIEPQKGDEFNAEIHEVVTQIPSDQTPGSIAEILSPGYKLHDKLLKPSQIAISQVND